MPYGMYPFAGMMGGVSPTNQAMTGVKVNSWLTPETINALRKDGAQFTLALSEEDIARAQCNHRNQDGTPSLNGNDDGSCKCSICGYTFNITDEYSIEQVEAACKCVTDILQTIKVMYISMTPEIGRQVLPDHRIYGQDPEAVQDCSSGLQEVRERIRHDAGVCHSLRSTCLQPFPTRWLFWCTTVCRLWHCTGYGPVSNVWPAGNGTAAPGLWNATGIWSVSRCSSRTEWTTGSSSARSSATYGIWNGYGNSPAA